MPSEAQKLLPCPFCGGAAVVRLMMNGKAYRARCAGRCGVTVSLPGKTREGATNAWNTRALAAAEVKPRVKPLEWNELEEDRGDGTSEPNGDWEAVTPFTVYSVNMGFASDSYIWDVYTGEADHIGCYDDPDTAKAAAQQHFEIDVLSALEGE